MNNIGTMDNKELCVVNNTANRFLDVLKIDKTRAIDTYDIAKKIGLGRKKSINSRINDGVLNHIQLRKNNNANQDRFLLAKAIAEYIVISAVPNANTKDKDIEKIISDLAISIVIPNEEVSRLYRHLSALNECDDAIVNKIALLYGVDKKIASIRINQIKLEENLKSVP